MRSLIYFNDVYLIKRIRFQIIIPEEKPLQLNVVIKNISLATGISGLAGNGINGEYKMNNGSTVANTSKESHMFDFGETCENK